MKDSLQFILEQEMTLLVVFLYAVFALHIVGDWSVCNVCDAVLSASSQAVVTVKTRSQVIDEMTATVNILKDTIEQLQQKVQFDQEVALWPH